MQQTTRIPSAWRALWYLVLLSGLVLVSVLYALSWGRRGDFVWGSRAKTGEAGAKETGPIDKVHEHPITHLINEASQAFRTLEAAETSSLNAAAAAYRKKRSRHPPPGFDVWYAYAVSHNAIMVEDFWDQIYDDLAPFRSINPNTLRKQAHVFTPKISIRRGNLHAHTNNVYAKLDTWADMLKTLAKETGVELPDIDIPVNVNNEPAMLVPWEVLDTAQQLGRPLMLDPADIVSEFSGLDTIEKMTENFKFDPEWLGPRLRHPESHLGPRPLWSLVRPACHPKSAARSEHVFNDIWDPQGETSERHSAAALVPLDLPQGSFKGYSQDWTSAIDACHQPNLQGLHGAFVAPVEMNVATKLFPLFSDTKLSMSSEILFPGATEWTKTTAHHDLANASTHEKINKLYWRGRPTAGREPARYWQRFHRHRLVTMLNATHVDIAEAAIHSGNESTVGVGYAKTFRLLPANEYHLQSQTYGQLAEWVNGWADVAFTDLDCAVDTEEGGCPYLDEYFSVRSPNDEEKYKYAIAVDGDSGSDGGELIRNLNNGQVMLRASIYRKWYDNRLVPWLHFVPLDNSFIDLYGVMEYFLGTDVSEAAKHFPHAVGEVQKHEHHFNTPESAAEDALEHKYHDTAFRKRENGGHEAEALNMAYASQSWARKALRREDMFIYIYRLLLEYARIVDDKRDRLGWVGDLVAGGKSATEDGSMAE